MRTIVNISLPKALTKEVERGIKNLHFASKSEFFRHLVREWLAGNLALELQASRNEYATGKAKKLVRVKDIWK
ncbi:MAG TPA: ribbon-helix-helix domain-containing protein [Patescibacteria group bacterium]|nr:ribbon-helix-helix domain-containing protein [Patescibacteria group bacterium]